MARRRWFPFTKVHVEWALALISLGGTIASLLGVPSHLVVFIAVTALVIAYAAGLCFHYASVARVHIDSATHGAGYAPFFRLASRSLLLMHVDDDPPGHELMGLYRGLLDTGVQIRRLIFLREGHDPDGVRWISDFGAHSNLDQRIIRKDTAALLTLSFAIVDEELVLLALPSYRQTENEPYSKRLVLRNLVELRSAEVTQAFLEVYETAWRRATPLPRRSKDKSLVQARQSSAQLLSEIDE